MMGGSKIMPQIVWLLLLKSLCVIYRKHLL